MPARKPAGSDGNDWRVLTKASRAAATADANRLAAFIVALGLTGTYGAFPRRVRLPDAAGGMHKRWAFGVFIGRHDGQPITEAEQAEWRAAIALMYRTETPPGE